jgi:uncharacterized protein (DUF488 family)
MLATIGYEKADLEDFIGTLQKAGVEVLVDVRDRAQSRRRGFSKTALSERLNLAGIEYRHFRNLGDPKEGREAARAGNMKLFRKIYAAVMKTEDAKQAIAEVVAITRSNRICLMCYERDYKECHRKIVSDHLECILGSKTIHLGVQPIEPVYKQTGRVLHLGESAAA